MKLDYSNHYKDRTPEETVNLIKTFFEKYNYKCIESQDLHSFKNIYTMSVDLIYEDEVIMSQRGKGVTKEYCAASAYAELYERFCNMLFVLKDWDLLPYYLTLNNKINGYSFNKDEINCKFKDLKVDKYFPNSARYSLITRKDFLKKIPYYSILDHEDKRYFNPIALKYITGSNGMAAGNTIEEALVQGISELFERNAIDYIDKHPNEIYHRIDVNSITNPILLNIFKEVEAENQKIIIFDFSYNVKYPVVGVFLVNTLTKRISSGMGSHPIFDIAIERTLTELYQDNTHVNEIINFNNEINLKNNRTIDLLTLSESTQDSANLYDEDILLNSQLQKQHSKYFLDSLEYSNIDLLNYIKNLCLELDINFYYNDYSLIDEVKAIHIYSSEMAVVNSNGWLMDIERLKNDISNFKDTYNLKDLSTRDSNSNLFKHFKYDSENYNHFNISLLDLANNNSFSNEYYTKLVNFYSAAQNTYFKSVLNKLISIFRYKMYGYTFEKTNKIFNLIDENISIDDWEHCTDINWIVDNILVPEYKHKYSEDYINNFWKIFI